MEEGEVVRGYGEVVEGEEVEEGSRDELKEKRGNLLSHHLLSSSQTTCVSWTWTGLSLPFASATTHSLRRTAKRYLMDPLSSPASFLPPSQLYCSSRDCGFPLLLSIYPSLLPYISFSCSAFSLLFLIPPSLPLPLPPSLFPSLPLALPSSSSLGYPMSPWSAPAMWSICTHVSIHVLHSEIFWSIWPLMVTFNPGLRLQHLTEIIPTWW